MKNLKIKKHSFIQLPQDDEDYKRDGIIGFQLVTIDYNFYGSERSETFDTKILKDGRQFVIDGDGFIPDNFEIKSNQKGEKRMIKIIEVTSINANGVKRQEHVIESNLEAYQIQIASEGFEVVSTAPAGHTQDTPQKQPVQISMPATTEEDEIAPSQDVETIVNIHLTTMQSNPGSLPEVADIINSRFIINMYTDKKRQKTYTPNIFTISRIDSSYVYCMSSNGQEYRYNRDNLGKIRIAKHGKGSASLNILVSQRPTLQEIAALSKKILEKVN